MMSNPLQDKIEGLRKPIIKYGEYRNYTLKEATDILNAFKAAYSTLSQVPGTLEFLEANISERKIYFVDVTIDSLFSFYDSHLKNWSVEEIQSLRKINKGGDNPIYNAIVTNTILDAFRGFFRHRELDDKELREYYQNVINTFTSENTKYDWSFHIEKLFDYFEEKYVSKRELKE